MNDFRCKQCNRLLAKIYGGAKVEIKCPRCKAMNVYSEEIFITVDEEKQPDTLADPEVA